MSASKPIYVDPETFDALKLRAKPFETPNAVLRRMLRLPTNKTKRGRPKGSKNRKGVEPV
jgi:hypothetical protein